MIMVAKKMRDTAGLTQCLINWFTHSQNVLFFMDLLCFRFSFSLSLLVKPAPEDQRLGSTFQTLFGC